jgi:SH3-like domain-containing protein
MSARSLATGAAALTIALCAAADAAGPHTPPYWASIAAKQARMRTGPGRTYPASWLYVRPDLPVRVVAVFKEWRRVEDPGGTQGWMLANLLSDTRTGLVVGHEATLRQRPGTNARVAWRAQPGVVGRVSQCTDGWCRFDVHGQVGYVEQDGLWGMDQDEILP